MRRQTLLAATAGIIFGAIVINAGSAVADMPTIDVTTDTILSLMQSAVTGAIHSMESDVTDAITGLSNPNSIASLLRNGFTQSANYAKGQIGAQQQITDASNTVMARFQRDIRNAQIRDEHVLDPQHCAAIDNGQVTEAAAIMGWQSASTLAAVSDPRGEAALNTPAYYGSGQAGEAAALLHMQRYCSQSEADAGLCTVSARANGDQRASSLFGADNLVDQNGVNSANDYATNLIQPIPPATLTGDQLKTINGQDAATRRRSYNARMSLARSVLNFTIGIESPNVQLTAQQKQILQNEGITPPESGSWLQVLGVEAQRRFTDVGWASSLQSMLPASVNREIANELAYGNYMAFQNYRVALMTANLEAARLAMEEEKNYRGATEMPVPAPAAN